MQSNLVTPQSIDSPANAPPVIDYSRKWYVMLAVGLALTLETIDIGLVNLALPTLIRTFNTDLAAVQWVILAFVLTQTTLMLIMGRLGDMVGKKPIFITGFIITGIGALLCSLAPNIGWLIAFRVIQAIGVAMALALGLGVATEAFPPSERGMALGLVSSIVSIGVMLGPVLGGLILDGLSWRWIFLVWLPICIVGLPIAIRYLPDVRPPRTPQGFDFVGSALFFIVLLAFLLATTYGRTMGYRDPRILTLLGITALFVAIFIVIELRTRAPVMDLRLFQHRLFSVNLSLRLLSFIIYVGVAFLLPFYNENVLGFSPRASGLLLTVPSIAFGITDILSGILSDRFGTHPVTIGGILLLLFGCLAISTVGEETSLFGYILRMLPIGIGMGMFQSPNNSTIFSVAPRERLGLVSSLVSVIRTLGRSTSIALIGAVWASRVLVHGGATASGRATDAPALAQLLGMRDAFWVAAALAGVMLLLSLWGGGSISDQQSLRLHHRLARHPSRRSSQ